VLNIYTQNLYSDGQYEMNKRLSWLRSYGSWIYRLLSPLKMQVLFLLDAIFDQACQSIVEGLW